MRIAIISDIHSNLEAFREVLADIDRSHVDHIVSLGDNIGYGPEPEEVLQLIRARNIPSIMGNHELGIIDPSCLSWFNHYARRSLEMNRELLSPADIEYIHTLAPAFALDRCLFVHGFPPDSTTTYLFDVSDFGLKRVLLSQDQELCFVGHTHVLELISFDGQRVRHARLPQPVEQGPLHDRHQAVGDGVGRGQCSGQAVGAAQARDEQHDAEGVDRDREPGDHRGHECSGRCRDPGDGRRAGDQNGDRFGANRSTIAKSADQADGD